ncbi:MAG: hypothetical protein KIT84_30980 [Labilithrix sp.]|nr:hypothetical protein [Labilithrix sp.]MCW5815493.1 hypothetical protein [Labilithrix sp.]
MRGALFLCVSVGILGCSSDDTTAAAGPDGGASSSSTSSSGGGGGAPATPIDTTVTPGALPPPGNPDGKCVEPAAALEDVSNPRTVIGDGTPASCTADAFVAAVAKGGVITFDCGPEPVKITLTQPAKIYNDTGPKIVIDGGNKVTLSGGGTTRILYMNVCDKDLVWLPGPICNDQDLPILTLQNLVFTEGDTRSMPEGEKAGGGAVWIRGGLVRILKSRFVNNRCADLGPDLGGGAVRVLNHRAGGSVSKPVYIEGSTFENNVCANGGALSSIGTSYTILNSVFTGNEAIGTGANSGQGGNGGAIYNDGNTFDLNVCGTKIEGNKANEGGSAIFFVSNDQTGSLFIKDSFFKNNPKGKFQTAGFPGMFIKAKGTPTVTNSTIEQ